MHIQPDQTFQCLYSFTGHSDQVNSVAFSPDSQTLATGSDDCTIKIWHLSTGEVLDTLTGHSSPVGCVAISLDGQTLASCSATPSLYLYGYQPDWDNTIRLWNFKTGQQIGNLTGHSDTVTAIAISPDRQILVSASWDNTIKVWDLHTGNQRQTLFTDYSSSLNLHPIAISPGGQILASESHGSIGIWSLRSGELLYIMRGETSGNTSLTFSPDYQTFVSGSRNGIVKRWNWRTRELLHTFAAHSSTVNCVAINPDGKVLASGSDDSTIKFWHLDSGELLSTLTFSTGVNAIAFSPDAQTLISASDSTIKLWVA
jgi:WD40 repeat protein